MVEEWKSPEEVKAAIEEWVVEYNINYLHSAHGYKSPDEVDSEERGGMKKTAPNGRLNKARRIVVKVARSAPKGNLDDKSDEPKIYLNMGAVQLS